MRNIKELRKLPISELTDEEIAKAAMDRLGAKMVALCYLDQGGQSYFIVRIKDNEGKVFWNKMKAVWENVVGKVKKWDKV